MSVRVGLIGAGLIGADHAQRLTATVAGARLVAVADPDAARAAAVAGAAGAAVHTSGEDLIDDPDVDAVLVASPGPSHARYVLGALAAAKPVFCEKPLATSAADCEQIVEAELAAGRRLVQVGYMRRYDTGYRAVKAAIDGGAIGRPMLVHSVHRNASVPPSYVRDMVIADTAVHDIDVCRWLLGQEFVSTQVFRPRRNSRSAGGLADPLLVVLGTDAGALVDVELCLNSSYGYDVRAEVVGESGAVSLSGSGHPVVHSGGLAGRRVPADWRERFADAYAAELRDWVAAAGQGGAGGPSAWDGYRVAAVSEATLQALEEGRAVTIAIPTTPDLYRAAPPELATPPD